MYDCEQSAGTSKDLQLSGSENRALHRCLSMRRDLILLNRQYTPGIKVELYRPSPTDVYLGKDPPFEVLLQFVSGIEHDGAGAKPLSGSYTNPG